MNPGFPINQLTDTSQLNINDLIPEIDGYIRTWESESAPIMSFFANPESQALYPTAQTSFSWYEERWDQPDVTLLTPLIAGAPGGTQVTTINQPDVVIGRNIHHVQTGQSLMVLDILVVTPNVSAQVLVTRVPETSGIDAIAAGEMLKTMPIFMPEGGYYPPPRGQKPKKLTANVGLSAWSVGITNTARNSPLYYSEGGQLQHDLPGETLRAKREMERYFMFAVPYEQSMNINNGSGAGAWENVVRSGTSLYQRTTTHTDIYPGVLDEDTLNDWFNTAVWGDTESGSDEKLILWGPDAMMDIDNFVKNRYRIVDDAQMQGAWKKTYGLNVKAVVFTGGQMGYFIREREFASPGDPLRHTLFAVNPGTTKIRHKRPSFIEVYADTQPRNADRYEMAMVQESGLQCELEEFNARLGWF